MTILTNGYPYAIQLLGYLVWQTNAKEITDQTIDEILDKYKEELYRNVYGKIYSELSTIDRDFVKIMANSDQASVSVQQIEKLLDKPHNYVSMYRYCLIEKQVIRAPKRGYLTFTLPFFKDFIIENAILFD